MLTTRNSSDAIETSRKVAAAVGLACALPALGGFSLGIALSNGSYLTFSALTAAGALIGSLWWSFARDDEYTEGLRILSLVAFVLASGLALYLNAIFLFWVAGYELPLGAARSGVMAENIYAGPFILIFALFAWVVVKASRR